ncbi:MULTISPECIES: hypothetical protein [Cysteiniphilum]|uniref:Uncharacterized protein n=1 Tax=Cysteiniphilum litorale TaxID=2056700 RepID=A0A8J2Z358_9GAMM|nr:MULTISPECIES: hypothetical protein [Cysteiniphilum]GGF91298.1 hypothetical protein GCM10010995_05710 [Cysteiniphilum litorale]
MSTPQFFTVEKAIELLNKMHNPSDKIIIDWITAEDIRDEITDYGDNDKVISDEQAYKIMEILDDNFDFGIGNVHANSDALHYMLPEIEDEIAEILA